MGRFEREELFDSYASGVKKLLEKFGSVDVSYKYTDQDDVGAHHIYHLRMDGIEIEVLVFCRYSSSGSPYGITAKVKGPLSQMIDNQKNLRRLYLELTKLIEKEKLELPVWEMR